MGGVSADRVKAAVSLHISRVHNANNDYAMFSFLAFPSHVIFSRL